MDKNSSEHLERRRKLIDELAESIIESTRPIIDPETNADLLREVTEDIRGRLQFEANVAVNEVVTRFARKPAREEGEAPAERTFLRFGKNFRAQHMLMFVSVLLLIFTGIPLKFPTLGISKFIIIDICGGLENSTMVHRVAASGLIIVGVWHLLYTFLSKIGRRDFMLMIPRPQDIKDFFQTLFYYFGRRSHGPKFGRFSFLEKFDYWAVYWGMVIMIGSGLILWFKEVFPRYAFDIAREAHSDEGLLATLAIVVWHFYNVHFNPEVFPMSWIWWHGSLTEDEMKHHHALEYAEILETEKTALEADRTGGSSDKGEPL